MPRKKKKPTFTPNWDALELTTYENFPALTRALGYKEAPAGDSKTKFLNDLEARFEYERDGNAYIIKTRRDKAIERSARANNSKYVEPLSRTLHLYAMLHKEYGTKQYSFFMTRRLLMHTLGMTSQNYYIVTGDNVEQRNIILKEFSCLEDTNSDTPTNDYLFKFETDRTLRMILDSFLQSEKSHKNIRYSERYKIRTVSSGKTRYATGEEEAMIVLESQELLKKMGVKNVFQLGAGAKRDNFYETINAELLKRGIVKCYKVFYITVFNLPETVDEAKCRAEFEKLVEQNKQMIKTTLLENIPKNYEKACKKAEADYNAIIEKKKYIGGLPDKSIVYFPPQNYVPIQTKKVEQYWGKDVNVSTVEYRT